MIYFKTKCLVRTVTVTVLFRMQINFQVLETTKKFLIRETTLHKQQNSNHRSNGIKITSFSKRGRIKIAIYQ